MPVPLPYTYSREANEALWAYVKITLRISDPYAEMVHGSCFDTQSMFNDKLHCQ